MLQISVASGLVNLFRLDYTVNLMHLGQGLAVSV